MHRFASPIRFLVVLLVPLLMVSVQAENFYQWRDANGNVIFSDKPPINPVEGQEIKIIPSGSKSGDQARSTKSGGAQGVRPSERKLLKEFEGKRKRAAAKRKQDALARAAAKNAGATKCAEARKLLDSVSSPTRAREASRRTGNTRLDDRNYLRSKQIEYRIRVDATCG